MAFIQLAGACQCISPEPAPVPAGEGEPEGVRMEVETLRFGDGTRTQMEVDEEAGLQFLWSEGDQTGVYSAQGGFALFRLTGGAGTRIADFDGAGFALADGETYRAFYPYAAASTEPTAIPLSYAGQRFETDDDRVSPMAYDYLKASAEAQEGKAAFHFSHVGAFVRLRMTLPAGLAVSGIEWVPMMGELPTGGTLNLETDVFTPAGTVTRFPVGAAEGLVVPGSGVLTVWTVLPPGDYAGEDFAVFVLSAGQIAYTARVPGGRFSSGRAARWTGAPYTLSATLESSLTAADKGQKTVSVASGQYSGITWLSGNRYAVVHDKLAGGGIVFFNIPISGDGTVGNVSMETPSGTSTATGTSQDPEGVAWDGTHLYVSFEKDQTIREYDLDGVATGRSLAVPADLGRTKLSDTNGGFEALTYNAATQRLWTTTEKPLTRDDFLPRLHRFQSFDADGQPAGRYLYQMDAPARASVPSGATYVHGIPALAALDDGRLIVMEREVYVPPYQIKWDLLPVMNEIFTATKLFLVDPASDGAGILRKQLLKSFQTGASNLANYEGMCLGPTLANGRRCLVLIPDSQGGMGGLTGEYVRVITLSL